jgi:hypothetical protein
MSKKDLHAISHYGLRRVTGFVPVWPIEITPNLAIFTIVDGACNELELLCPKPVTPEELAANPGQYIPTLKHILSEYDRIYWEHANSKISATNVLPKLFSLAPLPSFRWRYISMNAELLASMFHTIDRPTCPDDYGSVFYRIFNFEQFGFDR